jgi:hypothetical protein
MNMQGIAIRKLAAVVILSAAWTVPMAAAQVERGVIDRLEFAGGTMDTFVKQLRTDLGKPVNVLFRDDTQNARVPKVYFVSVDFETAIESVVAGTSLHVERVASSKGAPVYVISGDAPSDVVDWRALPRETEIVAVGDLVNEGQRPIDDVLETIDVAVFDGTQPDNRPRIRYHEDSGLLIVQGTRPQLDIVLNVVDQLTVESRDQRMEQLQRASERIRLETELEETRVQMQVASEQQNLAQMQLAEAEKLRENGVVSSQEIHEATLAVTVASAELSMARARFHAAQAQLDLFNEAEATERRTRTYEFGVIAGVADQFGAVLSAISRLQGPPIDAEQMQDRLEINATGAQHTVIEAVIEALTAAADQNPQ